MGMQHVRPSWPRVGKANATRIGNSVRTSFNAPKQLHPTIHRSNIVQKHIHDLVECRPFSLLVGALVTLNCVVIGLSSHDALMSARDCYVSSCDRAEDTEAWLTFAEIGFSAVFCFEFILRILSGQFFHCSSSHWKWSFLDFVMGMECVAEVALITFNFRLGYVRTIRLLRLARTVQMIRLLKFAKLFRTLRLMLLAICKSLVPLLWAMVVLVAIIFGFSVLFLEAVSEYLSDAGEQDEDAVAEMMRFFDGMPMAMLSLFMSITGGVSWIEVVDVLLVVHTFYAVMMVVFVGITILATMNIITGIFVAEAVETARMDQDMLVDTHRVETRSALKRLRSLFEHIDKDNSGKIDFPRFEEEVGRDDVKVVFQTLGLDVSDPQRFFGLLDVDRSDGMEVAEFVMGCMRLKGKGGNVDVEFLLQENTQLLKNLVRIQAAATKQLSVLETTVLDIYKNGRRSHKTGTL